MFRDREIKLKVKEEKEALKDVIASISGSSDGHCLDDREVCSKPTRHMAFFCYVSSNECDILLLHRDSVNQIIAKIGNNLILYL